jgi:amidase
MGTDVAVSTAAMVEAWEKHDLCKSRLLGWMSNYDVFICPVANKPAQPIDADAVPGGGGGGAPNPDGGWPYTGVFNCTGWPVVVVRAGSSADGKLPIGVQVVAAPWREDIAIAVASHIEGRSGGWKRPPV